MIFGCGFYGGFSILEGWCLEGFVCIFSLGEKFDKEIELFKIVKGVIGF